MKLSLRSASFPAFFLVAAGVCFSAEPAKTAAIPSTTATTAANAAALLKAAGLSVGDLLGGTKTGLGAMVDFAATELAKPGAVHVSAPSSMSKLVAMAKSANQTGAIDSFTASLTAAAASVAPQTTAVLKSSLAGLTADDAMALAGGAPDAATKLLRKAAEPALRTKLMPLVTQALASNQTAAKAKDLAAKAGPMAGMLGLPSAAELETYLFNQVLETSFGYLAKGEAAFRSNPGTLKDATATKVFSLGKK